MLIEFHTKLKMVQTIEVFKIIYRDENLVLEDGQWYPNVSIDCVSLEEDEVLQVIDIANPDSVAICVVNYDPDNNDIIFIDVVKSLMGTSIVTIDRENIYLFRKNCKVC